MKKLIYFISIFLTICIFPVSIKAEDTEYTLFNSDITINKDRTIDVKEEYNIYFISDTKTINRILDSNIEEIRPNNSSLLINSVIDNIKSDKKIKINKKSSITNVSMNVNRKQDEIGEYSLKYKVNLGKDTSPNYDEFYYDIVSNVNSTISSLVFSITLPDNIDPKKVKFSVDGKYKISDDDLTVDYVDNKIIGTYNPLLEKNQKFSIRIEFENGYFIGATDNFNYLNYLFLVLPIISFIVVIILWTKYGFKNKMNVRLSKDVPYKFDPAEIGYLYKGCCEEMDLVSLLVYLANKGYLKIVENDDGYKLGKSNSFKFVKLKDYDENNAAQKIIFEHLFRENDVAELENIEYHFAEKLMRAKSLLQNEDNYKKLFFTDVNFKKLISLILIIISVFLVNFKPLVILTNTYYLPIILVIVLMFGMYILFLSNTTLVLKILFGLLNIGAFIYFEVGAVLNQPKLLTIYIVGMIIILISLIIYKNLPERTKYGNKVLGDIYGFKMYLETISEKEMKERLENNSNFYYDMVPYAYVLDSFDIWIKKGIGLIDNPPEWYILIDEFKLRNFEAFIKNVMYTTTMVMMKRTYSSITDDEVSEKVKTNLND